MKSRKGILLGSILALVLSGMGNVSVRAAEALDASAYISKEEADALEGAEEDRIDTPELDLSELYTVAGSTVIAGIGITSEFDSSEPETEPPASVSSDGTSEKAETSGNSKTPETGKKTAETGKTTETEKKAAETGRISETETKNTGTSVSETTTPETKSAVESENSAAASQPAVSGSEKPKSTGTSKENGQISEATSMQDLQAEPAVTGDETDIVPFLLMGVTAGLLLIGDLLMKRKAD